MIGKMSHRITIQSQSRSSDGFGSSAVSYSTLATVFASIEPLRGSERLFGDQLEERTTHKITINFRRDVTNKNRILYSFTTGGTSYSRIFNINYVVNKKMRDQYLEIFATEGVAT